MLRRTSPTGLQLPLAKKTSANKLYAALQLSRKSADQRRLGKSRKREVNAFGVHPREVRAGQAKGEGVVDLANHRQSGRDHRSRPVYSVMEGRPREELAARAIRMESRRPESKAVAKRSDES